MLDVRELGVERTGCWIRLMIVLVLFQGLMITRSSYAEDRSFLEPVSKVWIGFGVPGAGIAVHDNLVYMAPGEGDLSVYDVSNLSQPSLIGHLGVGFVGGISAVDNERQRLLLGNRGRDLSVDISNPANLVGTPMNLDFSSLKDGGKSVGDLRGFLLSSDGKHVVAFMPYSSRALFVFRVKKDGSFKAISELELPDGLRSWGGGWLDKNRLFMMVFKSTDAWHNPPQGLMVIDLSNWNRPKVVTVLGKPDENRVIKSGVPLGKNRLVVIWESLQAVKNVKVQEIGLLDISDLSAPKELSVLKLPSPFSHVSDLKAYQGDLFVTLTRQAGTQDSVNILTEFGKPVMKGTTALVKITVDSQGQLKLAKMFSSPGLSRYLHLAVTDKVIFLSDYNFGLWCIKRDQQDIVWELVGGSPSPAEGHWITGWGNLAFAVTTFASQMHVIDLKDPKSPEKIGYFWNQQWIETTPAAALGAVYLPMIYGINIVDVSSPTNPKLIGPWPWQHPDNIKAQKNPRNGDHNFRIWSDGKRAIVVARRNDGWRVERMIWAGYDLSDPHHPRQLWQVIDKQLNCSPFTPTVFVEGDLVYFNNIAGNTIEVYRLNKTGPPEKISSFSTYKLPLSRAFNVTYPGHFAVSKGIIYMLNGGDIAADKKLPVLHVIDARDPSKLTWVRSLSWPGYSYFVDMNVTDGKLLLRDYWTGIEVYDLLKDPLNPVHLPELKSKGPWAGWELGIRLNDLWLVPGLADLGIYRIRN